MVSDDRYNKYIKSTAWEIRREQLFKVRGLRCERKDCTSEDNFQVHHLTYERLTDELDDDLMVLCNGCHYFVTLYYRVLVNNAVVMTRKQATYLALELISLQKEQFRTSTIKRKASTKNVIEDVACPVCEAEIGEYCDRPDKTNGRQYNHKERNILFREINGLPIPKAYLR